MLRLIFRLFIVLLLNAVIISPCLSAKETEPGQAELTPDGHKNLHGKTQVLVMLHVPAPRFRPDAEYSGNYMNDAGSTARHRIATDIAKQHQLKLLENWPMPALSIDCYVMEDTLGETQDTIIDRLNQDARVEWAQPIQSFQAMASPDPLYPIQPSAKYWHLSELHRLATGRNVRIAVIDSGVEDQHPDLSGQITVKENFIEGKPYFPELHGTQVSGVIAALSGNGIGITGIAPDARLMALRACWQESASTLCNSFTLGKAINFAILNDAQIINLSLSGPSDRLLQRLVQVAVARGIIVVAAVNPSRADGGFPAAYPGVLAVSDIASKDSDPRILIAPGSGVPTTTTGAGWILVSGSSFATAHVSGLVALLKQLRPSLKPAQLQSELNIGMEKINKVDACATIQRISGRCACSCSP